MALSTTSGTVVLPVEITQARNCFVRLPQRRLGSGMGEESRTGAVALQLSWETIGEEKQNNAYVSWNGGISRSDNALEIPATLARLVGLNNSETVKVDVIPCVENARRVHVEPLTCDDYEIVELNSELLERELLEQVSIVYTGQLLPVWVHTSILLTLKVKSFDFHRIAGAMSRHEIFGGVEGGKSSSTICCRISAQAELIVEPKLRTKKNVNSLGRRLGGGFENMGQSSSLSQSRSGWLRVQPWKGWCGLKDFPTAIVPSEVYADLCNAGCSSFALPERKFLLAEIVSREQGHNNRSALAFIYNPIMAAAICVQDMEREEPRKMLMKGHIGLSKSLLQCLNIPLLGNVEVKPLVMENRDSNWICCCPPESIGLALHKVKWEYDVEHSYGGVVGGGGDENMWSFELAPSKSFAPAMMFKKWCISSSASAWNSGMLPTPVPSTFMLLYNGMIIHLEGEDYQIKLMSLAVLEKTKQRSTHEPYSPNLESKIQLYAVLTTAEVWDLVDNRIVLGSPVKLSLGKDVYYTGPTLDTIGGVHTPTVCVYNHLASVICPEIAHLRRGMGTPPAGCVLVWGGRGVGKSTFCLALAAKFRQLHGCYAYTSIVNCKSLVGLRLVSLLSILSDAVSDAVLHIPSILFLDDLDIIAGMELDDAGPESMQVTCIAEYLYDLLDKRPDGLGIIASSAYRTALHPCLLQSGMFDTPVELTAPGPQERSEILEKLAMKQTVPSSFPVVVREQATTDGAASIDWNFAGLSTEGCMPSDLSKLIFRAQHSAILRHVYDDGSDEEDYNNSSTAVTATANGEYLEPHHSPTSSSRHCAASAAHVVTQEDFLAALEGFIPDGHKSARLSVSATSWSDIGGLRSVREKLIELLEMPIRYRRLLENAPTRIPRGILLYGPPGCGKTVIAGAAAKECGMTFIPVKGPEILDKYIGASEQIVRNLFYRAQSAAPCLLFFDEFESIAPRRGSDNTGVTDRVVNQLLTLLDGVEKMEGVYVMTATSRPDLVDPALLRPGRLDVHLFCSFPDNNERKEISAALSRNMCLGPDAHKTLLEAAESPAAMYLTGADLQGLVSTAHLNAAHKYLECKGNNDGGGDIGSSERGGEESSSPPSIIVTCADIEDAMEHTHPTISSSERAGLLSMYKAFSGTRQAPFDHGISSMNDGTLRTALRYRSWMPLEMNQPKGIVFIFHGLYEHGGRYSELAHKFTENDMLVFAHDYVGHGLTAAADGDSRGFGFVPSYEQLISDSLEFIRNQLCNLHNTLPVYIVGHSMGTLVGLATLELLLKDDNLQHKVERTVWIGCPLNPGPDSASPLGQRWLFWITKYTSLTTCLANMFAWVDPHGPNSTIYDSALTHRRDVLDKLEIDALHFTGKVKNKTALEFLRLKNAAFEAIPKIHTRALVLHGEEDTIAYPEGSQILFNLLPDSSGSEKHIRIVTRCLHEVLLEEGGNPPIYDAILSFFEGSIPEDPLVLLGPPTVKGGGE